MKTPPSPTSSASSTPFPSPDVSKLSPNPTHPSPEHESPMGKRQRVRSFVNGIRRTSSQLFKKDKKDGDSKKSISALVSDSLNVSTAATAPHILRGLSHSKHPSMNSTTSATTTESGSSAGYFPEIKTGTGEGSTVSSTIIEVDTPVSPTVVYPSDAIPMNPLEEEENVVPGIELETAQSFPTLNDPSLHEAESQPIETVLEGPDPLQFPLPPSPTLSPSPFADPAGLTQTSVSESEAEVTAGDDPGHDDDVVLHDHSSKHEPEDSREKEISSGNDVVHHDGAASQDEEALHGYDVALHHDTTLHVDAPLHNDSSSKHESEDSQEVVIPSGEGLVLYVAPNGEVVFPNDDPPPHGDVAPHDNSSKNESEDSREKEMPSGDGTSSQDEAALHGEDVPLENDALHDDNSSPQPEPEHSSPLDQVQPSVPTDTDLIIPPTLQASQPPSTPPSPSLTAADSDREKQDQEMINLCIPVLIPPMLFWPISNMRLTYFFTPVLTWWLAKGVLSYPYLYS